LTPALKPLVAALALTALAAPAGAQAIVTERNISLSLALVIAATALDSCSNSGYHVAVTVLDRAGRVSVVLRDTAASLNTLEGSQRKAFTARTFRMSSDAFAKRVLSNPELTGQRDYTGVILLGGGLPIKVGDDVIGAVGVSGATGAGKDEICAQAGLDKVADQLK
jgi:uncharacterized protein GlcG (DUF336 family)